MERTCSACDATFVVEGVDLAFYESMQLSSPECCPACRMQRRCLHRNERHLYKRQCDICKKATVAMYPPEAVFPVCCSSCFFSDEWDPLALGRPYDEQIPFFNQLESLHNAVPHIGIMNKQSENSDYCNYSYANKNCYRTSGSHQEEDCLYGAYSTRNRDCVDSLWVYGSERLYECLFCGNCYDGIFLDRCEECQGCSFSRDLKGCKNCLFCVNLRHKEYCIFNEQHSKAEFEQTLAQMQLHTHAGLEQAHHIFRGELAKRFPVRALYQVQCEECTGDSLSRCKSMRQCFYAADCDDCAYCVQMDQTLSSMDMNYMGYDRSERCIECIGCQGLFDCVACSACWHGSTLAYCCSCFSCKNCIGCMSLQQKSFCILNMQYTEEEYRRLVPGIIERMRGSGEYGAFFPPALSPFAYNETMTMDWYPLDASTTQSRGFRWREEGKISEVPRVIHADDLPDGIADVSDDILSSAIMCNVTGRPFLMQKRELQFYRDMQLPLPRVHPDERHRQRILRRNPAKLWERSCAKCGKGIQTTYNPERSEVVVCEECYLKEVY